MWRLRKLWALLRYLPLIHCPACKGQGGEMSGYECPEWSECSFCYPYYERAVDWGYDWACGRIAPWAWPWSWLYARTQHYTFRGWLLCKLGIHRTAKSLSSRVCIRCYKYLGDNGKWGAL